MSLVVDYFEKLSLCYDVFADRRIHKNCVGPSENVYSLFLKRLHGHQISFGVIDLPGYGSIQIPSIKCFDLSLVAINHQTVLMIDVDVSIRVVIDWYDMVLSFEFDQTINFDKSFKIYKSRFFLFDVLSVSRKSETVLSIVLDFRLSGLLRVGSDNQPLVISDGERVYFNRILRGVVVAPGYPDILPEQPIKHSDASKITGVSHSTFSELRHGKTRIANLAVSTASVLTDYGLLRFFDRYCLDTLSGDVNIIGDSFLELVVVFIDGTCRVARYVADNRAEFDLLRSDYEKIVAQFDAGGVVHFPNRGSEFPLVTQAKSICQIYVRDNVSGK